jgi:hypothetical protein
MLGFAARSLVFFQSAAGVLSIFLLALCFFAVGPVPFGEIARDGFSPQAPPPIRCAFQSRVLSFCAAAFVLFVLPKALPCAAPCQVSEPPWCSRVAQPARCRVCVFLCARISARRHAVSPCRRPSVRPASAPPSECVSSTRAAGLRRRPGSRFFVRALGFCSVFVRAPALIRDSHRFISAAASIASRISRRHLICSCLSMRCVFGLHRSGARGH